MYEFDNNTAMIPEQVVATRKREAPIRSQSEDRNQAVDIIAKKARKPYVIHVKEAFKELLNNFGQDKVIYELLVSFCELIKGNPNENPMHKLISTMDKLDKVTTGRRGKLLPVMIQALNSIFVTDKQGSDAAVYHVCISVMNHGPEVLNVIHRCFGNIVKLPSESSMKFMKNELSLDFQQGFQLQNVPRGMRLSLVETVNVL